MTLTEVKEGLLKLAEPIDDKEEMIKSFENKIFEKFEKISANSQFGMYEKIIKDRNFELKYLLKREIFNLDVIKKHCEEYGFLIKDATNEKGKTIVTVSW